MRSRFAAPQDETSDVNLTPMLDVVFILLVFFLVTASFLDFEGVPVYLPAAASKVPDAESILVSVEGNGVFVVNGRPVTRGSLFPYVQALHARNADASYAVMVAGDAIVDDTVAAIDAGRRVGYDTVPIQPRE